MTSKPGEEKYVWSFQLESKNFFKGGEASTQIKQKLKDLSIPSLVIRKVSIIAYEAEMNVIIHSNGGEIFLEVDQEKVVIRTEDVGPGIPDINQAMEEGFTTVGREILELGFGAGMGLPNIKNFSDDLEIDSGEGQGTILTAIVYL